MFRVLVLDDSPERREAFAEALEGCQVRLVATSKAARIALIDEDSFDLVCLDHDLGESKEVQPGNGLEVAEFITRDMRDKIPRWVLVHSSNIPAADRMVHELADARVCDVLRSAYSQRMLGDLARWIRKVQG